MHSAKMYGLYTCSCHGILIYRDGSEYKFYDAQNDMNLIGVMPKGFNPKQKQLHIWMIAKEWIRK